MKKRERLLAKEQKNSQAELNNLRQPTHTKRQQDPTMSGRKAVSSLKNRQALTNQRTVEGHQEKARSLIQHNSGQGKAIYVQYLRDGHVQRGLRKFRDSIPQRRVFTEEDARRSGVDKFGTVPGRRSQGPMESFLPNYVSTTNESMPILSPFTFSVRAPTPLGTSFDGEYSGGNDVRDPRSQMKLKPFPTNVRQIDKYFKWKWWLSQFEMAAERFPNMNQRVKATTMNLLVGEEVSEIIMTEGFLVPTDQGGPCFNYYDFLVSRLTDYFAKLTDNNVNAREFKAMRQGKVESTRAFGMRVKMAAQRINLNSNPLITATFIDGLRDAGTRDHANDFNLTMEDVMEVATRREHEQQRSDLGISDRRIDVAAIAKQENLIQPQDQSRAGNECQKRYQRRDDNLKSFVPPINDERFVT